MADQRLPAVSGDDGIWGEILNQFLAKEHYNTGVNNIANGGHKNITIQPGTTTAGSAPIKFTSGPLMASPEAGAMEFLDDKYYLTGSLTTTRKVITTGDTNITVSTTAPSSPSIGDLWIDTN